MAAVSLPPPGSDRLHVALCPISGSEEPVCRASHNRGCGGSRAPALLPRRSIRISQIRLQKNTVFIQDCVNCGLSLRSYRPSHKRSQLSPGLLITQTAPKLRLGLLVRVEALDWWPRDRICLVQTDFSQAGRLQSYLIGHQMCIYLFYIGYFHSNQTENNESEEQRNRSMRAEQKRRAMDHSDCTVVWPDNNTKPR